MKVSVTFPDIGSLDQQINVMDSLCAGHDLLASDEHIITVGQLRILRIRHGVEGTLI